MKKAINWNRANGDEDGKIGYGVVKVVVKVGWLSPVWAASVTVCLSIHVDDDASWKWKRWTEDPSCRSREPMTPERSWVTFSQTNTYTDKCVYSHSVHCQVGMGNHQKQIGQAFDPAFWSRIIRKTSSNESCEHTHSLGSQPNENRRICYQNFILFCDNVGSSVWLQQLQKQIMGTQKEDEMNMRTD